MYLGKVNTTKASKIKTESFPISEQGYTMGKILDGTYYWILLDIGVSKSYMSISDYLCCKSPHSLPKVASRTQKFK